MAEIKPFRALRYNEELGTQMANLVSPLFDVVSLEHRKKLYSHKFNSIHLSVPQEGYHSPEFIERSKDWQRGGILISDEVESIYVYYQYYTSKESGKSRCRKGFIADSRIYDWSERVVFRHEGTIPKSVAGRKSVLEDTGLNVSPLHGLYTDQDHELEHLMDQAIENPIYDTEDYQGVRDVLGRITDTKIIEKFVEVLKDKPIILADGHHRYEAALQHKLEQNGSDQDPYNFQMMYLTNTESDDLEILPTHRLIQGLENFDEDAFLESLSKYFHVLELEDDSDVFQLMAGRRWAFGLYLGDKQFNIRLKQHNQFEMDWDLPELVKNLDLTVLHYFLIEKILKIPQMEQSKSENLVYERNAQVCLKRVLKEEAHCAILTQPLSVEKVKDVCYSGYTLPQKSTFFYPKVICGYLFNSIKPEDHD